VNHGLCGNSHIFTSDCVKFRTCLQASIYAVLKISFVISMMEEFPIYWNGPVSGLGCTIKVPTQGA